MQVKRLVAAPAALAPPPASGRPGWQAAAIPAGLPDAAQPAAGGVAAGALTWLLLTARHDLAPPR